MNDARLIAGRVLKRLIKENFKSQAQFAEEYHIDLRTLSRYVNKEGINKVELIQEFADYFDVPITYFFKE